MKKYRWIIPVLLVTAGACTKDNYIDSGLSNGRFAGSLLEYMEAPWHSYDWDSTALMVHHAGADVVRLFEGKDPAHPKITFFGPTNHSIRRYMFQRGIERVSDMDPAWCKRVLLSHVVDGKIFKEDIPEGIAGTSGAVKGEGGKTYKTLADTHFWAYTYVEAYNGVAGLGRTRLYLVAEEALRTIDIASANIEPDNCVVHSLQYAYTLGDNLNF